MMSLIDDALACLKPAVPAGTRLIVFGSQARGDARTDSDPHPARRMPCIQR